MDHPISTMPSSHLHARRTGDTGASKSAVPGGILREVLLVIVLRVVELGSRHNFGRDPAVTGPCQLLLVRVPGPLCRFALLLVRVINSRAVLRADIVPLPHALGR